jgi:hypothetical protein
MIMFMVVFVIMAVTMIMLVPMLYGCFTGVRMSVRFSKGVIALFRMYGYLFCLVNMFHKSLLKEKS